MEFLTGEETHEPAQGKLWVTVHTDHLVPTLRDHEVGVPAERAGCGSAIPRARPVRPDNFWAMGDVDLRSPHRIFF